MQDTFVPTVLKLEQFFAVSRSALLVRLSTLRLISKVQYNQLNEIPVIHSALEHGYDTALYKLGNKGLVIGDYGVRARSLFEEDLISEGHYVELMSKIGVFLVRVSQVKS